MTHDLEKVTFNMKKEMINELLKVMKSNLEFLETLLVTPTDNIHIH